MLTANKYCNNIKLQVFLLQRFYLFNNSYDRYIKRWRKSVKIYYDFDYEYESMMIFIMNMIMINHCIKNFLFFFIYSFKS